MLNQHFVILGALINLVGSSSYILSTLKGKTQPNRVSYFMWTLAPALAVAAQIHQHVGLVVVTTFMSGFMPLLIFLASFRDKRAVWKLNAFDLTCGALSCLGLALWAISKEANVAIVFAILADFLAAIPTLRKAYSYPESENYRGYAAGAINALIGLLVIKNWTFASYAFPAYLVVICVILVTLIRVRLAGKSLKLSRSKI